MQKQNGNLRGERKGERRRKREEKNLRKKICGRKSETRKNNEKERATLPRRNIYLANFYYIRKVVTNFIGIVCFQNS